MSILFFLIPIAMFIALIAGLAFLWSVNNDQFSDLDRESSRILLDDERDIEIDVDASSRDRRGDRR